MPDNRMFTGKMPVWNTDVPSEDLPKGFRINLKLRVLKNSYAVRTGSSDSFFCLRQPPSAHVRTYDLSSDITALLLINKSLSFSHDT